MKFLSSLVVLALAGSTALANTGVSPATELEARGSELEERTSSACSDIVTVALCALQGKGTDSSCNCVAKTTTTTTTTTTTSNQCSDSSKVSWCSNQGWHGCDSNCNCASTAGGSAPSQPTGSLISTLCSDTWKIQQCAAFGKSINALCNAGSCSWLAQIECELLGGTLDSGCSCPVSSMTWKKRHISPRHLCNNGKTACPVNAGSASVTASSSLINGKFECLDIKSNIDSCGGCVSEGQGQDCSSIEFVEDVTCHNAQCKVISCEMGYIPSANASTCEVDPRASSGKLTTTNRQKLLGTLKGVEKFWGY
ncbi:hypothetical protein EHS25_009100 [Saitozyma podzolica]|jgi:hypothetical protein|uniref:Protein CPL1-like domain-containing protein n=1 Tax=Saitozyma podzolica TaxID=1890683 RepID=A0A427YL19_9TREE|nr:hypothetical protein EHS25_009100 [Saitozyma podzolica]